MKPEMIIINVNLVKDVVVTKFKKDNEEIGVANFTLIKKYGKEKEYINCCAYKEKVDIAKEFKKGNFIHIYGYYKTREKDWKIYKNFIVASLNKNFQILSIKTDSPKFYNKLSKQE